MKKGQGKEKMKGDKIMLTHSEVNNTRIPSTNKQITGLQGNISFKTAANLTT